CGGCGCSNLALFGCSLLRDRSQPGRRWGIYRAITWCHATRRRTSLQRCEVVMPEVSLTGLLMVAVVAFLAPLLLGLSPVLRLPSVVLEIVAGIVIGPSVLGWGKGDLPLSLPSLFGLAFLLFGLEVACWHSLAQVSCCQSDWQCWSAIASFSPGRWSPPCSSLLSWWPPVLATCGIRRPEWAYEDTQSCLLYLANF